MFSFSGKKDPALHAGFGTDHGTSSHIQGPVTYGQKIDKLHKESLAIQKRFLEVVVKIRESASKGEAIDEIWLFKRDLLYKRFNRILNIHRRLKNYVMTHPVRLNDPMDDEVYRML